MKYAIAILAITATIAHADPLIDAKGNYHAQRPTRCETAQGMVTVGSDQWLIDNAGWRLATEQEQADWQAAQDAAAQDAEQYADPQPAVFAPRVDSTLTNILGESQILVDAETGAVFALDETGSPEHTMAQKQAQNAARETKKAAAREAKKRGGWQDRLDAIEAMLGITE